MAGMHLIVRPNLNGCQSLDADRLLANDRLREFAQFIIAPLSPGFNLDRYDRELRCPFPSEPLLAPESEIWRREHGIGDVAEPGTSRRYKTRSAPSRAQARIAPGEPL